ncbi:hypothetical protein TI05_05535 [Achromatium sp. WMS3]|nr:hypothetical protein TI05_05535 [Achromatium sp. WMS3]
MKDSKEDRQNNIGIYTVGLKLTKELGWIFRLQPYKDLGIHATVEVIKDGESNGEMLALHVKSGSKFFTESTSKDIIFQFKTEHYTYCKEYPMPVLVMLHNPSNNAVYWQVVNQNTVLNTEENWKVKIPLSNILCKESATEIAKFCNYKFPVNSFSIMELINFTYGSERRYNAQLLLNQTFSQVQIVQLIRKVTNELRDREYYMGHARPKNWKGKPANVIWLYIYLSFEEERNKNKVCMSQWIDPLLEDELFLQPPRSLGTKIGEDLVISWSKNYQKNARLCDSSVSKEDYFAKIQYVLEQLDRHIDVVLILLNRYHHTNTISEASYLKKMSQLRLIIKDLYLQGSNVDLVPPECVDFGMKFQSVIAYAKDVANSCPYKGEFKPSKNYIGLWILTSIENYLETRAKLQQEQQKIMTMSSQ